MAGSWVGLHARPVRPALGSVPPAASPAPVPAVVTGRTLPPLRARHRIRVRRTKGMRRGSPTQRQGRTRGSPLSPSRRGGRHLACVAQDRVAMGQGGQAPVPEDPWWPPALPGDRDPPARRRAPGAADGLSVVWYL